MPQQCTRVKIYDPDGTEFFYECKSNVAFQGHIRHLFENLIEFSQSFQSSTLRLISDTNGLISSHYGLQEASSGHWIEDVNDSKFQKEDNILFFKLRPLSRYISDVESLLPPPTNTTTTTTISPPTNINNNNNSNISTPNSSTPNSQPSSLRSHIESQIQTQFKMRTTTLVNSNLTSTNATNNNTTTQNNNNNNSKSNKKALRKAIESLHIHLTLLMLKERTRNDHVYISSDNLVKIIRIIFRSPTLWAINLLVGYLQRNNSFSTSASNINDNGNTILKSITNTMLTTTITTTTTDISPSATINRTFSKSTGRTNTLTSSSVQTSNSSSSSSNNNNSINNSSNSNGNSNGNTSNQFSNRDSLGHQDSSGNQISLFTLIDQSIKTCSSEFKKNFYLYLMEQYDQRRDSILDTVDAAVDTDANDDDDLYFNKAIRASASVQSLSSSLLSIPNLHSEIIIQTISMINNIYLLSPNPVNYIIRLHKDNIFRSLYELKIKDNLISDSIQYKTLRKYLVNELKDQCLESIDTERIQHQILFSDLWSSTLTLYPYGGCSSYKWLLLGFRGANPSDDLNCTGVIALRNLNYFAKQHTSLFNDNTLVDCQMLSKSYPVALVGISLSYLLSKAYGFRLNKDNNNNNNDSINNNSGSSNSVNEDNNNNNNNNNNDDGKSEIVEEDPSEKWDIVFSDYNWLDECYVSTFILFESLWSFQSISYSDFSTILSTTESIITKTIEKKPVNSQEFTEYIVGCLLESTEVTNAIDVVHRFNQLLSNDTSITDIAYSCHSLIRFFGESLDSLTYQFLPPNLVKSKSDSLQERNNRIETFIGEWLDSEQVDYGEKIRFSVQIQESLLTASLKNNSNNNNNNYANGGGIVNSPLKNVQNSLNGSGGVSLRSSNSSNNQNGSNTNTDPVVESRINKLNKFFGEMIHPSQLGSSTDSSPSVVSTSPNPPTSTTSTTLATLPPATTTTTNNKNNNNNTHDTSTTTTAKNNHQTSKNESLEEDQIKPKSPEEKSIDKVQRLLGVDLQKANISFSKLHKMQQPPSPPNELLPAQPIQLNQSQQQQQQKQSPVPISSVVVSTSPKFSFINLANL
ncbi:engulfment and cell motility ELM family protein [Heterostelium album PN500]|uniref:Engulfment and cell motility ELM family protein n=1 Tax=Heterostelium pallidum (strain ATCC 26659 / Pp 5 / PN500) TaxID=670386 RepID=D3BQR9_HETP5|nr:engulfment and cell motility ELM family protein [Heterostelium album PN500]EFA76489.1 engulfment and cell motility ELM family protein [Heterostelium album PN500]|eukprot:XP_020428621.1 engulfment and cell motility ELM family protein [Heterostelium album PN500]